MSKKVAIPIDIYGHLEKSFGHNQWFALIDIRDSEVVFAENVEPPVHEYGLLPQWLMELGVTDVIANEIGKNAIQLLTNFGIHTYAGAPQLRISELVNNLLKGELKIISAHSSLNIDKQ